MIASPAAEAEEVGFDLRRAGAVGLVVGLLIAAAVTRMMALRSRTFTNRGQPENVLGTHLLAAVPSFRDEHLRGALPVSTDPSSAAAESFRFFAGSLRSTPMGQGAVYAFVSGQSGDGKTVTAANTALAAARGGSRVLAIDADFGNQHLTTLLSSGEIQIPLSYQTATGLADLAASESAELSDVVRRVSVGDDAGLFLLNKGSGEVLASDFVASSRMRDVFETMRAEFDLIVIDTAPFTKVAYAGELVRHADGAIVVVPSRGNVGPVEEVAERLAVLGVEPTGYVYNGVRATDYKGRSEGSLRDSVGA